jgi:hypothetical protein
MRALSVEPRSIGGTSDAPLRCSRIAIAWRKYNARLEPLIDEHVIELNTKKKQAAYRDNTSVVRITMKRVREINQPTQRIEAKRA